MKALLRWFWQHRDHGFRPGGWGDRGGRWDGDCRRCGGYEYGEPRHPNGWFGPKGVLR